MAEEKNEKTPELFPILGSNTCPACGSDQRLSDAILKDLVSRKELKDTLVSPLKLTCFTGSLMRTLLNPQVLAQVIMVDFEICGKCSCIYAKKLELGGVPIPNQSNIKLPNR